jgi:hypothetical protein
VRYPDEALLPERPQPDALFTNRFAGKIKLTEADWAGVRQRVAEFDKYLG